MKDFYHNSYEVVGANCYPAYFLSEGINSLCVYDLKGFKQVLIIVLASEDIDKNLKVLLKEGNQPNLQDGEFVKDKIKIVPECELHQFTGGVEALLLGTINPSEDIYKVSFSYVGDKRYLEVALDCGTSVPTQGTLTSIAILAMADDEPTR